MVANEYWWWGGKQSLGRTGERMEKTTTFNEKSWPLPLVVLKVVAIKWRKCLSNADSKG